MTDRKPVKTRLLLISDTHSHVPGKGTKASPFKNALPPCDVFIHAGDMTNKGEVKSLQKVVDWISKVEAEIKIVIAGKRAFDLLIESFCLGRVPPSLD